MAEALRMQRLSANLKASGLKPKALTDAEERRRKEEGYETEEEEEEDNEPQAGPSSTSADKGKSITSSHRDAPPPQPQSS